MEPSEGRALLEEMNHQGWTLRLCSLALFPVSLCNVTS